ncbi:lipase secretion chaperone [Halomonadaceae bacterium KBTZ08]
MSIKRGIWAATIAGIAALGLTLFGLPSPETPEAPHREGSVTTLKRGADKEQPTPNTTPAPSGAPQLPLDDTVKGIAIDGAIRVDMNGNLIHNRDLRRFMDFFIGLTRSPDDEAAMRQRMRNAMSDKGVPPAIQDEVMTALDDYLDYREAAAHLETRMGKVKADEARQVLKRLAQLRRNHLGEAMAEGFFGKEQRRIKNQLARQRIRDDPNLSTTEKQQRLQALEANLPDHVQKVRERSRIYANLRETTRRMRREGASKAQIQALRQKTLGARAAERLAQLDHQRAQWQRKLARYQQRKQRIEANDNLTKADRQKALEQLRSEHFDSQAQRRRAQALSRIDAPGQDG